MEDFFSSEDIQWLIKTVIYFVNGILLFYFGKLIYGWRNRKINVNAELVKKDNFAFALATVGYYIGLLIAIGGALLGESQGLRIDIIQFSIFGVLAVFLLNAAAWVNDRFLLQHFSVQKEIIKDQNAGTGIIEAANYIASGLIIFGAVSGDIDNFFPHLNRGHLVSGILSTIGFWLFGQVLLLLTTYMYNAILPYNIHDEIEKDNVAAGMGFAGALVALSVLISYGTQGDFAGWPTHIQNILFDVFIGLLLLPIARWVTDWILLPGEKLTDEIINQKHPNKGAALVEAFAYIGGAVLITWCL